MNLDDMQFDNDADRRRYIADLARLKRIREEERLTKERLGAYVRKESRRGSKAQASFDEIEVPNFRRREDYDEYDEYYDADDDYYDDELYDDEDDASNYEEQEYVNKRAPKERPKEKRGKQKKSRSDEEYMGKSGNSKNNPSSKKKRKKKGIILLQLLLLCVLGIGIYIAFLFLNTKQTGYYTVAIFGVDSRNGNLKKDALADVNIIASINRETGDIDLVSVYRDNITEIDGKGTYHKLNEAYFRGGPEQAIGALERNLDLKIDDYASFNWKAVIQTINILGGVDLEITEPEFKYINGFITETVNSTGIGSVHLKGPGMQHLDGVQAVAYARLRLMDTDYNRTERQRRVISLAFEKAKKADFLTLNQILVTVLPQISTSLTIDDMVPFAKNINNYRMGKTTGFPFEKTTKVVNKRDYVIPISLKNNVIALHKFLYGENTMYVPSAQLSGISNQIIKDTGIGGDADTEINVNVDKERPKQGSTKQTENQGSTQAAPSQSKQEETGTTKASESTSVESKTTESKTEKNSTKTSETKESIINDVEENDEHETSSAAPHKSNSDDAGAGPAFDKNNSKTQAPTKETKTTEEGPGVSTE